MSDCRVPMPVYSKDLIKTEENNEIPPIPEGWMGVVVPKARIVVENDSRNGANIIIEGAHIKNVVKFNFSPKPLSEVDVFVLIKETS